MSIRSIQTKRILEDVTHSLYSTGVKPTLADIMTIVSAYFSKYPVGLPLEFPSESINMNGRSSVEGHNNILARLVMNIDVLYEAALEQVDEIMMLNTVMRTHLERLRTHRRLVETRIDDYLLSLNNTDGYYFSFSDTFSSLDFTDLSLTDAHVDTTNEHAQLPIIGSLSKRATADEIMLGNIDVKVNGVTGTYETLSPFPFAIDSLTNTAWAIKVRTNSPAEVVVRLMINAIGSGVRTAPQDALTISKVEIDPYGVSPVQAFVRVTGGPNYTELLNFGYKIETSTSRMAFSDRLHTTSAVEVTLRKTAHDYIDDANGQIEYIYLIGAKDISILRQVYDNQATWVSDPISLPTALAKESVIDAVSLVVSEEVIEDTSIDYYVAVDPGISNLALGDYDWKHIGPLGSNASVNQVIRFEGAQILTRNIKADPGPGEFQLFPLDNTNNDLRKRNPTPSIIPGVDVYRITAFDDDFLARSITLEEGVNTTRIFSLPRSDSALDLSYWVDRMDGDVIYGETNSGNGFFYGGDVGEANRSVFAETYLSVETEFAPFLSRVSKVDANSRTWTVKVFLNGREVAYLPETVDTAVAPWAFRKGLNHIVALINIPDDTVQSPHPYVGVLELMDDTTLTNYGTVKLGTWHYVDLFDMQHNAIGQPYSFTIHNKEIISRRKPTANYRLRYAKSTAKGPAALRLRADLRRETENQFVSPKLNDYRLRFSYGDL